ncbi:hypothetical protein CEUSTIGMA_g4418.t1 [Chlamydomonas eustigma]|uniref:Uncharacterized protein n=1 Tax=Chlamydomonas eustigma TaxID=1157962 RepID=A0A250X1M2_9CHLO|nr:hypothetical protein CEUSTIGMA_g4418.t1 [Chlamydomonas eustigma]|eukprot:GAX76971.1 hypothetical protein CEUSTIGMA_g4418.t1 [Chlamydomonas eustigma]
MNVVKTHSTTPPRVLQPKSEGVQIQREEATLIDSKQISTDARRQGEAATEVMKSPLGSARVFFMPSLPAEPTTKSVQGGRRHDEHDVAASMQRSDGNHDYKVPSSNSYYSEGALSRYKTVALPLSPVRYLLKSAGPTGNLQPQFSRYLSAMQPVSSMSKSLQSRGTNLSLPLVLHPALNLGEQFLPDPEEAYPITDAMPLSFTKQGRWPGLTSLQLQLPSNKPQQRNSQQALNSSSQKLPSISGVQPSSTSHIASQEPSSPQKPSDLNPKPSLFTLHRRKVPLATLSPVLTQRRNEALARAASRARGEVSESGVSAVAGSAAVPPETQANVPAVQAQANYGDDIGGAGSFKSAVLGYPAEEPDAAKDGMGEEVIKEAPSSSLPYEERVAWSDDSAATTPPRTPLQGARLPSLGVPTSASTGKTASTAVPAKSFAAMLRERSLQMKANSHQGPLSENLPSHSLQGQSSLDTYYKTQPSIGPQTSIPEEVPGESGAIMTDGIDHQTKSSSLQRRLRTSDLMDVFFIPNNDLTAYDTGEDHHDGDVEALGVSPLSDSHNFEKDIAGLNPEAASKLEALRTVRELNKSMRSNLVVDTFASSRSSFNARTAAAAPASRGEGLSVLARAGAPPQLTNEEGVTQRDAVFSWASIINSNNSNLVLPPWIPPLSPERTGAVDDEEEGVFSPFRPSTPLIDSMETALIATLADVRRLATMSSRISPSLKSQAENSLMAKLSVGNKAQRVAGASSSKHELPGSTSRPSSNLYGALKSSVVPKGQLMSSKAQGQTSNNSRGQRKSQGPPIAPDETVQQRRKSLGILA